MTRRAKGEIASVGSDARFYPDSEQISEVEALLRRGQKATSPKWSLFAQCGHGATSACRLRQGMPSVTRSKGAGERRVTIAGETGPDWNAGPTRSFSIGGTPKAYRSTGSDKLTCQSAFDHS
jgi:hypothetical protein